MTPMHTPPSAPLLLCRNHTIHPANSGEIDCFVREVYAAMEPALTAQRFVKPEFRISLALHEAVVNAWRHGNGEDRSKAIFVRWRVTEELLLEVLDQGSGFDFLAIADPRIGENIDKPCGRGIAMITFLADRISWQDQGRRLTASFSRNPGQKKSGADAA